MPAQNKPDIQFTPEETTRLFKRFLRLDTDKSGGLDQEELMKIQRFSNNPLSKRFLEIFDTDKDGVVNFNEFLEGMSVFATKGSPDKKLYFIFQMYDVNQDGFLSNGDLFNALKMMVGENLDDVCLQQIVDKTMRECDKDFDGRLNFEEFKEYIIKANGSLIERISVQEIL